MAPRMPPLRGLPAAVARRANRVLRGQRTPRNVVRPGPPPGLACEILNREVLRGFGAAPTVVQHTHLSGWKHAGAYRVFLDTAAGQMSLVFKDARYSADHIGALQGLPVRPGGPELAVYTRGEPRFAHWIPRALWCMETVPNERYQYLLEDLDPTHARPGHSATPSALCAQLPQFHDDLHAAFGDDPDTFLRYDAAFAGQMLGYAHDALSRYAQRPGTRAVRRLLGDWDRLEQQYLTGRDEVFARVPLQPIHGDLNLANVLNARHGGDEFRLLDWEWAGVGLPHFDLATALKGAATDAERQALEAYGRASSGHESTTELWQTYRWCQLLRSLLDASFLARQRMDSTLTGRLDLDRYVRDSVSRGNRAVDELERIGSRTWA